jgi:hypothetical protein
MRRTFLLPQHDMTFLESLDLPWETIVEGATRWLLLHEFPIPNGYNLRETTIALSIEATYPDTQIDMVYVCPHLQRSDGQTINALCDVAIDGKMFQRWSRHYTPQNPWKPNEYDISTHLELVKHWFAREFEAR